MREQTTEQTGKGLRMNRREFLKKVAAGLAVTALAGCGPSPTETPPLPTKTPEKTPPPTKALENFEITYTEVDQYLSKKWGGGEFDVKEPDGEDKLPQETREAGMLLRNSFDHASKENQAGNNIAGKIKYRHFELPSLQWVVEVHQQGKEEERWAVFSLNELKKKVQESKVVDAVNFWDFSKLETYGNNQDRMVFVCMEIKHRGEDRGPEVFIGPVNRIR